MKESDEGLILFVVYAVVTWYLVCRWRRTWRGALTLWVAMSGLTAVAFFHLKLNDWTNGTIYLRQMQTLLYPYIALVMGVGLFLFLLPRLPSSGFFCRGCRYDLDGLDIDPGDSEVRCPECGEMCEVPDHVRYAEVELIGLPDPATVPSRRTRMAAMRMAEERMLEKRRARGSR